MAETESLRPDLNGTPCAATDCLDVADTIGQVTMRCDPENGLPPHLEVKRLDLPLCTEHSHLLRGRPTFEAFDSGT